MTRTKMWRTKTHGKNLWKTHRLDTPKQSKTAKRWLNDSTSAPIQPSQCNPPCHDTSPGVFVPWKTSVTRFTPETPPKINSSPLKNGGWKPILSYWEGNFWGTMLNFGGVCPFANRKTSPKWKTMTRKYQTMGLFTVYPISDGWLKKWMVKRKLHFLEDTAMEGYVAFGMRITERDNMGGFN